MLRLKSQTTQDLKFPLDVHGSDLQVIEVRKLRRLPVMSISCQPRIWDARLGLRSNLLIPIFMVKPLENLVQFN